MSPERDAIAVVGMAGRFPGAKDLDRFWQNLLTGVESMSFFGDDDELRAAGVPERDLRHPGYIRAMPLIEDADRLDAPFFGLSSRQAEVRDPQLRVLLETAHTALQDANCDPAAFDGRIGVYAGARNNVYMDQNVMANRAIVRAVGDMVPTVSNHTDYVATSVAYQLNLRGPAVSMVTACSTSLVAVHSACRALRAGECELALAGGVEVIVPLKRGYFYSEGAIYSADGHVRPFDANASGTVFGSGCGVVALKRLGDALADRDVIHAVIRGSAINNDGADKSAFASPSASGQMAVLDAALRDADVDPASIRYVEAHGTGTLVGDPIEVSALSAVYGRDNDRTGHTAFASVKGNVGHLGAAAGVCGLIKAAHCVREGVLPPSVNFTELNPKIDLESSPLYVNRVRSDWPEDDGPRRAGVSSFGVGGTNAHLILEQPPEPPPAGPARRPRQLITLSAKTPTALDTATDDLGRHLATFEGELADVSHTLNAGRADMPVRRYVVAKDHQEAASLLTGEAGARQPSAAAPSGHGRPVAFLFPGQGAQHVGMARGLYDHEPVFAAEFDRCADVLAESHGLNLRELVFADPGSEEAADRLNQTAVTQPALFAVEHALARLLREWGLEPAAMAGHSVGEYVAACLAGVMEPEDALRLVAERGALMQSLPGGSMLAVTLAEEMLLQLLPPEVDLAAVNAPGVCVVSGPDEDIDSLRRTLSGQGIGARPLRTSHAFHSRMMDPILDKFRERVAAVTLSPPRVPYVSNLTGAWIADEQAVDPDYWVRHLRGCVRFADTVALLTSDSRLFLEVGPGRTLAGLVGAGVSGGHEVLVAPTMRHPQHDSDDVSALLDAVGQAWAAGAPVDWSGFWGDEARRQVRLPTYPYERQRHWIDPDEDHVPGGPDADEETRPYYVPVWRGTATPRVGADPLDGDDALWVVFSPSGTADEAAVADALLRRLSDAGAETLVVRPGDRGGVSGDDVRTLRVRENGDYTSLFADIAARRPARVRVVHAWSVGASPAESSEQDYASHWLDRGFYSGLWVLQEISRQLAGVPVDLFLLSSDMQQVSGEARVEPAKAALLGLVKLAPREFDGIACRSVDVSLSGAQKLPAELVAEQIFAELVVDSPEDQVAYRGRKRWAWSYDGLRLDDGEGLPERLKERGVYVLSGGLGGLGLLLAEQLGKLAGARLALIGRTGLPDREQWPQVLAERDEDDPVAVRIRGVQVAEKAGAEVLVCAGSVTDEARLREIREEVERVFGPVDGVFHLAGITGGGMLETRRRADAERVLTPKVAGAYALEKIFEPDLFVLYSSIAAVSGDFGLGDYAAANAVLDSFAQSRWAAGRDVVSVNWPPFIDIGMTTGAAPSIFDDLAQGGPAVEVDAPLLRNRRELANGAVAFEVENSAEHWVFGDHRIDDVPTMPGTGIIEFIRQACQEVSGNPLAEMRDLVFLRLLQADPEVTCRVELRPADDGGFDVTVKGHRPGQEPLEYGRGHVRPADPQTMPAENRDRVRELVATCVEDAPYVFDKRIWTLDFGRRWDAIRGRKAGGDVELVQVELAEEFAGEAADYLLHPTTLDNAVVLGQRVVKERLVLPLGYDRLVMRRPLPARFRSVIRHLDDGSGDIVKADVTFIDDDDSILVEVEGFSLIRVDMRDAWEAGANAATALDGGTGAAGAGGGTLRPTAELAKIIWASEGDDAFTGAEGMDAMRRILGEGVGPQVICAPEGLGKLLRRMRTITRAKVQAQMLNAAPAAAGGSRDVSNEYAEPETDTERVLAALWRETLGLDRIGADDDFFELGGNSLVAVQLVARMTQRFETDVAVAQLFEARTVRSLAATVEQALLDRVASLSDEEAAAALAALEASDDEVSRP